MVCLRSFDTSHRALHFVLSFLLVLKAKLRCWLVCGCGSSCDNKRSASVSSAFDVNKNLVIFGGLRTKLLLLISLSTVSAKWASFDHWVCRSSFSDYCGAAGTGDYRDVQGRYTVNQYIVSGPPAAYLCSLAPACSGSPFGSPNGPTYGFADLGQIASSLGANECKSVLARFIPNGASHAVGICGELSRAIIECPRMPLAVFHDSGVEVLAIKRNSSIGSFWEDPPPEGLSLDDWLECGTAPSLVHSSDGDEDRWDGLAYRVYWTDDDPTFSGQQYCTSTDWVGACGGICSSGFLRWPYAYNPFHHFSEFDTATRCAGTQPPDVVEWREYCMNSDNCKSLPWTREFEGSIYYVGGAESSTPEPTTDPPATIPPRTDSPVTTEEPTPVSTPETTPETTPEPTTDPPTTIPPRTNPPVTTQEPTPASTPETTPEPTTAPPATIPPRTDPPVTTQEPTPAATPETTPELTTGPPTTSAPVEVLTWVEQQELLASDGMEGDNFGYSLAINKDIIIVGSHGDTENDAENVGSAYVFVRNNDAWAFTQKLIASDAANWFGEAVAIQGDTAIVGAKYTGNGAAYIFMRQTDTSFWMEVQKIVIPNSKSLDKFGEHVAIDGQSIVIGEPYGFDDKGAAYVYIKTGDTWTLEARLLPPDGQVEDEFGYSVDISLNSVIVGAPGHSINSLNTIEGYAVVFQRNGALWDNGFVLRPNDGVVGDRFGQSVAIETNTVVVGNGIIGEGEASYVFQRTGDGNVWTQMQKLDAKGFAVAISGNVIISHRSAFGRTPVGEWEQQGGELVTASDPYGSLAFTVAISEYTAVIGNPSTSNWTGNVGVFVVGSTANETVSSNQRKCVVDDLGDFDPNGRCDSELNNVVSCATEQISDSQCLACRGCIINFLDTFVDASDVNGCAFKEATICQELEKCGSDCGVCIDELENYFECLWMKVSVEGAGCGGFSCNQSGASKANVWFSNIVATGLAMFYRW